VESMKKLAIFCLLAVTLASAQQKHQVAVLMSVGDFDPEGLILLTHKVREIATKNLPTDKFILLKQDVIIERLGGDEEFFTVCKERTCIAEITKRISVDYGMRCDIIKRDKDNTLGLTFELYSVRNEATVETFTKYPVKDLLAMIAELEKRLPGAFKKMIPVERVETAESRNSPATLPQPVVPSVNNVKNTENRGNNILTDNKTPEFYYRLGVSAYEAKDITAAIDALEKFRAAARAAPAKTLVPNRPEALKMLALAYEYVQNNKKASEIIEEYLQLPGVKDQEAAYKRALLIEAESPEQAIRVFEENTTAYPHDYRNFLKAGIYYSRKGGNIAKAIMMFEKCVQIDETIARPWFDLGLFYGGQNRNKDMMRAFEKFISVETRNADAILRVGEYLLVTKNMPSEAITFLEKANALKPNDPKVMALLSNGYMKIGRTDGR